MELYLIPFVALVGALCVLDLILTLGIVRRLRLHTELISRLEVLDDFSRRNHEAVPIGLSPGHFEARGTNGQVVSPETLVDRSLIGFFAADCASCHPQLPVFASRAMEWAEGGGHVMAVVAGSRERAAAMIERLEPVGDVVLESANGRIAATFHAKGYPSMCIVEDGAVVASGHSTDRLIDEHAEIKMSQATATT